jgi:hypothetical protein
MTHPPPHPPLLTQRQLRRLEMLPNDYKVVWGARDGIPIVESPTGQTLRLQPTGHLAATTRCAAGVGPSSQPSSTCPSAPLIVVAAQRHAHRRRVPDNNSNQEGL